MCVCAYVYKYIHTDTYKLYLVHMYHNTNIMITIIIIIKLHTKYLAVLYYLVPLINFIINWTNFIKSVIHWVLPLQQLDFVSDRVFAAASSSTTTTFRRTLLVRPNEFVFCKSLS